MAITLGIGALIFGIIGWAMCAVPKSDYEQRLDDEAQIEYLKQYREKHS